MARNYSLDTSAAREANTGSKRIQETGKYIGTIVAAFYERNDKGTESVSFMFKSNSGKESGPLTIYTHRGNGEVLSGYKLVNAIMTCCQVRSLTVELMPVQIYDFDEEKVVTKTKECYKELTGKNIGFVLQEEEYEKKRGNGGIGIRIGIFAPFDPVTELMAAEILDKKNTPEQLGHVMTWIAKNPTRKLRKQANNAYAASSELQSPLTSSADFNDFDDSIPFN